MRCLYSRPTECPRSFIRIAIGAIASITHVNFTYVSQNHLAGVFKHDPMITENILNPLKEL